MRTACEQCGRAPVNLVTSRKQLGMIPIGRTWGKQAPLGRDHARQQLAADLAVTALPGAPQLPSGPGGAPMPEGRA